MPTLEEFFANAIEQNDPEAMVEDQYKSVGKEREMTEIILCSTGLQLNDYSVTHVKRPPS